MKFGGVALDGASRMLAVAGIVENFKGDKPVIVASAMKGITDKLVNAAVCLGEGDRNAYLQIINSIEKSHFETAISLPLNREDRELLFRKLKTLINNLRDYTLSSDYLDLKSKDYIISFGEQLSTHLLTAAVRSKNINAIAIDSGDLIVTDNDYGNAKPDMKKTKYKVKNNLIHHINSGLIPVVTGFYGKTSDGHIATLGRGGSDYSASILANVCDAKEMIVWKEVNGIYTEDPKVNLAAQFLTELTYEKAATLAKAGAKILHPESMEPVREKRIPVRVKNVFNPLFIGSLIY